MSPTAVMVSASKLRVSAPPGTNELQSTPGSPPVTTLFRLNGPGCMAICQMTLGLLARRSLHTRLITSGKAFSWVQVCLCRFVRLVQDERQDHTHVPRSPKVTSSQSSSLIIHLSAAVRISVSVGVMAGCGCADACTQRAGQDSATRAPVAVDVSLE